MNHKLLRITTVPISLKTLLKGQHRFMLANGFEVVGVSSAGSELEEVSADEGVRTVAVEMTRTISPLKDLKSLWQLYKLFRKEQPLIVHSHTPKAGIVGMMAAWLARVPIRLHTVAGLPLLEATGGKRKLLNVVEKITYACATRVYPNSIGLRDIILDHGYARAEKLHVIGQGSSNGIDTGYFDPALFSDSERVDLRRSFGISPDDFVFVFVGRLVRDKGINELIRAFGQLVQTFEGSREPGHQQTDYSHLSPKLLLVGPFERELDPVLPDTEVAIEQNPHIIHVGYQPDVRPYLAIADCLAFPSYREGFPNVVMQAGAMGLPAIVTDINGCNEIVVDRKNGTIIPPKNLEALRQAMERMMDDREYYERLKENARPMITSRYEQQVVWNAILAEYERLLKEKGIKK